MLVVPISNVRPASDSSARRATTAVASILKEVVAIHAGEQPGVHLGTDVFPLQRST